MLLSVDLEPTDGVIRSSSTVYLSVCNDKGWPDADNGFAGSRWWYRTVICADSWFLLVHFRFSDLNLE